MESRTRRIVPASRSPSMLTVRPSASRVLYSTTPVRPTCSDGKGLAFYCVPASGDPFATGSLSPSSSGDARVCQT
jgi:hypothetical protein